MNGFDLVLNKSFKVLDIIDNDYKILYEDNTINITSIDNLILEDAAATSVSGMGAVVSPTVGAVPGVPGAAGSGDIANSGSRIISFNQFANIWTKKKKKKK